VRISFFSAGLILALLLMAPLSMAEDDTLRRADSLIRGSDFEGAIALLDAYLQEHPEDANALMSLGNAYHAQGDYEAAVEVNRRAANTRWAVPTARYNEACALSLLGRSDEAQKALQAALQAGFLDYDLIASDADLENLRRSHPIDYPRQNEYIDFEAHNKQKLAYKVVTPTGYDADKTYPALVVFAPGDGRRSADWALQNFLGEGDSRQWIVVYAIAPAGGWFTHPAHHAFNDLLDRVRETHKIEGNQYHLVGFAAGARIASTYSQMSKQYFVSLTTLSAWHWRRWDDEELASGFGMPVRLVVGAEDAFGVELNQHVRDLMGEQADCQVVVVDSEDHMLPSIRHGRVLEFVPRQPGAASQPE